MTPKHIVIFSHGFGTLRDARGLFTDIVESLPPDILPILFDYNTHDAINNTITVLPPSDQALTLNRIISETKEKYPGTTIDLICHSQGCLIAAMLAPKGIRRCIFIAPSMSTDMSSMMDTFRSRPGTTIDTDGWSTLARRDGSKTLIPKEYWKDREARVPIPLYNSYANFTQLFIIVANQDDVLRLEPVGDLAANISITNLDGNHEFGGKDRIALIENILRILE